MAGNNNKKENVKETVGIKDAIVEEKKPSTKKKEKVTLKFENVKNMLFANAKGSFKVDENGIAKDVPFEVYKLFAEVTNKKFKLVE